MNKIIIAVGSILVFSCPVFAQQTLLGKYSGSFMQRTHRGDYSAGLTLEIVSLEGDTAKGKVWRSSATQRGSCAGEYPVEGTLKDNALILKSTEKGGHAADCGVNLKLTVEGSKLVGTMNNFKAELSK